MRVMGEAEGVLRGLFDHYVATPDDLPAEWRGARRGRRAARARRIADYIAGMTDRYAMVEHTRIFGSTPELRETRSGRFGLRGVGLNSRGMSWRSGSGRPKK